MERKNKTIAFCVVMIMVISFIIVGIKTYIANPQLTKPTIDIVVPSNE